MSVLVDTSVWSLALRRKKRRFPLEEVLKKLISDGSVQIIGPIRQEILSGIAEIKQYQKLKKYLGYFRDIPLRTSDFELAAEFSNRCRKSGVQGSHTDFLICAIAYSYDLEIFTLDEDFRFYQKVLPVKLLD